MGETKQDDDDEGLSFYHVMSHLGAKYTYTYIHTYLCLGYSCSIERIEYYKYPCAVGDIHTPQRGLNITNIPVSGILILHRED